MQSRHFADDLVLRVVAFEIQQCHFFRYHLWQFSSPVLAMVFLSAQCLGDIHATHIDMLPVGRGKIFGPHANINRKAPVRIGGRYIRGREPTIRRQRYRCGLAGSGNFTGKQIHRGRADELRHTASGFKATPAKRLGEPQHAQTRFCIRFRRRS